MNLLITPDDWAAKWGNENSCFQCSHKGNDATEVLVCLANSFHKFLPIKKSNQIYSSTL